MWRVCVCEKKKCRGEETREKQRKRKSEGEETRELQKLREGERS